MLETLLTVDAPSLSHLEQASFRFATAAALSDHVSDVRGGRIEVGHHDRTAFECAIEVTLATGDVVTIWAREGDLFDALEVCLRTLGHELRALLRSPRRAALAHVA